MIMDTRFLIILLITSISLLGMSEINSEETNLSNTNEDICTTDLNKAEFKNIAYKTESSQLNDILGCGDETKVCGFIYLEGLQRWWPIYGTPIVVTA